jgi:hypothetical protein
MTCVPCRSRCRFKPANVGGRNMRGMFRQNALKRFRSILFRAESSLASNSSTVRLSRSCRCFTLHSLALEVSLDGQVLKPSCVSALKRIFKLCDTNKDGILDPSELNEFQVSQIPRASLCRTVHMLLAKMFRCAAPVARARGHKRHGPRTY